MVRSHPMGTARHRRPIGSSEISLEPPQPELSEITHPHRRRSCATVRCRGQHHPKGWFGDPPLAPAETSAEYAERRSEMFARVRREDSRTVDLRPFVVHDVRRTVRSQLSRLKVAEEVREAILAHVRPGIVGVYDHDDYLDEKQI